MQFAQIPSAHHEITEKVRRELFKRFSLEKTEIEIMKELSKADWVNVYQISKSLPDVGHYSTILRALRRLKAKRLVKEVFDEGETARSQKIYELTVLGELITAVSKEGWVAAANVLAKKSPSFVECMKAHRPLYPYYYWIFTRDMIEKLKGFPKFRGVEPDLEKLVKVIEHEWIAENIITLGYAPENRPAIFEDVRSLSHVGWIRSIIINLIDEYVTEENEWLKGLDDFKRRLVATDREAKLTKFLPASAG